MTATRRQSNGEGGPTVSSFYRKRKARPTALDVAAIGDVPASKQPKPCLSPVASPVHVGKTKTPIRRGARRGLALLAAAGVEYKAPSPSPRGDEGVAPSPQSPSPEPTKGKSPRKRGADPGSLQQPLPKKLAVYKDMFVAVQTVHGMMKARGARTTFQTIRPAVEEACSRRFTTDHLAQLQHLLPGILTSDWVPLPVAPHSTRTEPQLMIALRPRPPGMEAAPSPHGGACSPRRGPAAALEHDREALQGALSRHLLDSYAEHLHQRAMLAEEAGRAEEGEALRARAGRVVAPCHDFLPPYPEAVPEVPLADLPPRPDSLPATPSARGRAAAPCETPESALQQRLLGSRAMPSTSGRPPVYPASARQPQAVRQRRLSFSLAADAGASALDRLHAEVQGAASAAGGEGSRGATRPARPDAGALEPLLPGDSDFEPLAGGILAADDFDAALAAAEGRGDGTPAAPPRPSAADAALLSSIPAALRRRSSEGVVSLSTLRRLSRNEDARRRLSGAEAVAAREASAVLAALPRTFSRLQRVFGTAGPRALTREAVLAKLRGGAGAGTDAELEAGIRALAEHAPEYVQLKPYGACGTPAVWVDRGADARAVMGRLMALAEGRHAAREPLLPQP
ncbi:CDT1 [Auxenochlorella protothecoides x Auxenochlorella symbiontica]